MTDTVKLAEELIGLAEKATAGEWYAQRGGVWDMDDLWTICAPPPDDGAPWMIAKIAHIDGVTELNHVRLFLAAKNTVPVIYCAYLEARAEIERLREALRKIMELLSFAGQDTVTQAAAESNRNSAWWQAKNALDAALHPQPDTTGAK